MAEIKKYLMKNQNDYRPDLDNWIVIDNIQGNKDNNSLSVRKFNIAKEKRMVF